MAFNKGVFMNHSKAIKRIALEHLDIETFDSAGVDCLDFYELAIWNIEAALKAAYEAGYNAAQKTNLKIAA